jgi:hypothetical protein
MNPELSPLLEKLDEIQSINCGGCGVAALAIYRWLEKRGEKSEIVFAYDYKEDLMHNNQCRAQNGNLKAPCHVLVFCQGVYIDSRGGRDYPSWDDKSLEWKHTATEEELLNSLNKPKEEHAIESHFGWNPMFKRSNVPEIASIMGVALNDVIYPPGEIYKNNPIPELTL